MGETAWWQDSIKFDSLVAYVLIRDLARARYRSITISPAVDRKINRPFPGRSCPNRRYLPGRIRISNIELFRTKITRPWRHRLVRGQSRVRYYIFLGLVDEASNGSNVSLKASKWSDRTWITGVELRTSSWVFQVWKESQFSVFLSRLVRTPEVYPLLHCSTHGGHVT